MMPFEIIRNDITNVTADVIVNTANPHAIVGDGTDAAIHRKAGPKLLEARKKIGEIPVGQCAITPAFALNAQYVIHTVGPVWEGGLYGEEQLLNRCFRSALELAATHGCSSIAFPLISTGTYGFPRQKALQIAIQAFSSFLIEQEMHIYLVVWDQESFLLSQNLFNDVQSYIDQHYIDQARIDRRTYLSKSLNRRDVDCRENSLRYNNFTFRESLPASDSFPQPCSTAVCSASAQAPSPQKREDAFTENLQGISSLDALLAHTDAGFSETLLKLIDKTGKKDSYIYKKANVSKQHFSKIRNNPDYKPTKPTAIAFAIALELDLEQTKDLIGRAGYALTNSSKFDVIIMYFIARKNYDIFDINMTLFQFDQMTLGV